MSLIVVFVNVIHVRTRIEKKTIIVEGVMNTHKKTTLLN